MIAFVLLILAVLVPVVATVTNDPAPSLTQSTAESRNIECVRLSEAAALGRYPGRVAEPSPRGDYIETSAVECRHNVMQAGDRPGRDEAILSGLSPMSSEIAQTAIALGADVDGKTWLVDAFYPDAAVAGKITFAAKTALIERAQKVSDRIPILASGDILVLGRLEPRQAYPVACSRYWAEGSLGEAEVLLAVVLLDARETILHAGLCAKGNWRWLR